MSDLITLIFNDECKTTIPKTKLKTIPYFSGIFNNEFSESFQSELKIDCDMFDFFDMLKLHESKPLLSDKMFALADYFGCKKENVFDMITGITKNKYYFFSKYVPYVNKLCFDNFDDFITNKYKYNGKKTPLMIIAEYAHKIPDAVELCEVLIKSGANIDMNDKYIWSALTYVARYGFSDVHLAIAKVLINNGANVNIKSINSKTPLIVSSEFSGSESSYDMVKLLVDNGAKIDHKDIFSETALTYAIKRKYKSHPKTICLLTKN